MAEHAFNGTARVIEEIAAERRRQVEAEGWTADHDNRWALGQLPIAAMWYAVSGAFSGRRDCIGDPANPSHELAHIFHGEFKTFRWPWALAWWKPSDARRDLIRAAALLVAEIERLDRDETATRLPRSTQTSV